LLQQLLDSDSDVYLLDEPELGMGNSYITATIMPKLVSLAKQRKTVVVATHNANIAVGTLPYVSIFRTHMNGEYRTYVGNPFCDELYNIDDGTDVKNWTVESMHTLEGGQNAFYERKDIYESGRKDY
jgi:ABC-type Mn2+/Zn2+ transport system ATPase subunit